MELSLPIAAMLGITVLFLVRRSGLKVSHAVVALLLGFYLYSTSFSSDITEFGSSIAGLIGGNVHP